MRFPVPSFEQSNPLLTGISAGEGMIGNLIRQRAMQNQMHHQQLMDQLAQQEAPLAMAMKKAQIDYMNAQTPLEKERANAYAQQVKLQAQKLGMMQNLLNQVQPHQQGMPMQLAAQPQMPSIESMLQQHLGNRLGQIPTQGMLGSMVQGQQSQAPQQMSQQPQTEQPTSFFSDELPYRTRLDASLAGIKLPDSPKPLSSAGKALYDYQQALKAFGPDDPRTIEMKQYLERTVAGQQGLSVTGLPGGGFKITQGGVVPSGDAQSDFTLSPASPHSRYSTGGGTLINPQTGQAVSIPTRTTASKLQQAEIADEIVPEALTKIYHDLSPGIGPEGMGKRAYGMLKQAMFGETDPTLSHYTSAITSEIPQNVDQLLKSYQLNATEGNRSSLQHSLTPKWYDTPNSYGRRIADTIAQMLVRQKQYQKYLKQGISLNDESDKHDLMQDLSDKIYGQLTGENAKSQKSSPNYTLEDIQYTAKLRNMTIPQVKAWMKSRGLSYEGEQ